VNFDFTVTDALFGKLRHVLVFIFLNEDSENVHE